MQELARAIVAFVAYIIALVGLYFCDRKRTEVIGGTEPVKHTVPARSASDYNIILFPGLGNGTESYNWNTSSEKQRADTGLPVADSLQEKLAEYGTVTTFDPPGYGVNTKWEISSIDDYCEQVHVPGKVIVCGHSIGARVAQWYAQKYNTGLIMIDPTPDYMLDTITYDKHIQHPGVEKYARTRRFLDVVIHDRDKIKALPWDRAIVVYSIDSADSRADKKGQYFDKVQCKEKIRVDNGTHWVHVTNQSLIVDAVARTIRE